MKVTAISFLLCILLISNVYAIRINEVEMNPAGDERILKNEWVEFYNDGEISLEGYRIINNDGDNISLNGSFNGYFVYTFANQWLDNSNESIYLYKDLVLIDQTDLFDDSNNNDLTHQFCEGGWEFLNSTRGQENNCIVDEEIIPLENNESQENSSSETSSLEDNVSESQEEDLPQTQEEITSDFIPASIDEEQTQNSYSSDSPEKIFLSPKKNSEEIFVSSEGKLRNYVPYLFMALVIILCIYLAFKKL